METYKIGRSADCDIVISDETVSRTHAEFVFTLNGRYYLTDCGSTNGTKLEKNGSFVELRQEFVVASDVVLFGDYRVRISELINRLDADRGTGDRQSSRASGKSEKPDDSRPVGPVVRNPETGEPILSNQTS